MRWYSCNCSRTTGQVSLGGRTEKPSDAVAPVWFELGGFRRTDGNRVAFLFPKTLSDRQTFLSSTPPPHRLVCRAKNALSGTTRRVVVRSSGSRRWYLPPSRAPQNAGRFRTRPTAELSDRSRVALPPNGELWIRGKILKFHRSTRFLIFFARSKPKSNFITRTFLPSSSGIFGGGGGRADGAETSARLRHRETRKNRGRAERIRNGNVIGNAPPRQRDTPTATVVSLSLSLSLTHSLSLYACIYIYPLVRNPIHAVTAAKYSPIPRAIRIRVYVCCVCAPADHLLAAAVYTPRFPTVSSARWYRIVSNRVHVHTRTRKYARVRRPESFPFMLRSLAVHSTTNDTQCGPSTCGARILRDALRTFRGSGRGKRRIGRNRRLRFPTTRPPPLPVLNTTGRV